LRRQRDHQGLFLPEALRCIGSLIARADADLENRLVSSFLSLFAGAAMSASPIFAATPRHQAAGIAILRVIVGVVFTAHGYQKLFVYGIAGVQGAMTKMGTPIPMVVGPLVTLLEFFGGLALIVGLLTRLAALGFAIEMLGAVMIVHLANGFFLPSGYEFALTLLVASLAIVVAGPGSFSIDAMLASRVNASQS
jgi:putative oxidoreductase